MKPFQAFGIRQEPLLTTIEETLTFKQFTFYLGGNTSKINNNAIDSPNEIACLLFNVFVVFNGSERASSADVGLPLKNLSSKLTHWELTLKLKESSFWGHSVTSQRRTHEMIHTVSFLWAFPEFATLTVSSLLPLHGELIRWSHRKLIVWVILWVVCEVTERS